MKRLGNVHEMTLADEIVRRLAGELIEAVATPDVNAHHAMGNDRAATVWISSELGPLRTKRAVDIFHEAMAERPVSRCPHCRYDLRGHSGKGNCPECGRRITAEAPDMECSRCQEIVPANFESCWNCGQLISHHKAEERSDQMQIRLAAEGDIPAILEISNWAVEHTAANFATEPEPLSMWREAFAQTHEKFPWLIAVDNTSGKIIGFSRATPWKGRCAYNWSAEITVYVHPNHHGRGIGKALYAKLLKTMKAQGYRSVLGGITQPNPASVRLHESFGMKRVAVLENIGWKFNRWHDVGYWQLQLHDDQDAAPGAIRPVRDVFE